MTTRFAHRAKLMALDLTITAIQKTRRSGLLRTIFRRLYSLFSDGSVILWGGALMSFAIAGFLIGYLSYFLLPK